MSDQLQRIATFKALHAADDTWIIPNPWDAGSAKILAGLGFKALATTSSGYAFTLGKVDGQVSMEQMLAHCTALVAATNVPVSADFENGYAEDITAMTDNIKRLIETGIAGLSIEDFSRDEGLVYPIAQAVERVQAAAETVAASGVPVVLTARAEGLLRGIDDKEQIIERLQAFSRAGADVLYAPAVSSLEDLKRITAAIDKPFNVLASFLRGASVEDFAAAGARRISVGGALTYAALAPLMVAASEMLEHGTFNWIENMAGAADIRRLLELQ